MLLSCWWGLDEWQGNFLMSLITANNELQPNARAESMVCTFLFLCSLLWKMIFCSSAYVERLTCIGPEICICIGLLVWLIERAMSRDSYLLYVLAGSLCRCIMW
jgi:hypothetical protein